MAEVRPRRGTKIVVEDPRDRERAFHVSVGDAIRRGRKARGWTQAALAGEASLSPNYIARLERGELGPSLWVAHLISRALGVELGSLLSARRSPPPLNRARH